MWWVQFRVPPGSTCRYQYSIFDSIQVERSPINLEEAASMSRAMPRLDLLVIAPGELQLIELKPNAQLKDVGQVLQYRRYLERDVFIKNVIDRPIRMALVTMNENGSVRAACDAEGIEYHVIPLSELPELPPE